MQNSIIGETYLITKKLGQGAFGQVFKAINPQTKQQFAVKLQPNQSSNPQLGAQAKMLKSLSSQEATVFNGIPQMYKYGCEGQYNYMVMRLLGKSLGQIIDDGNPTFDLKTVLMIGLQLIQRLEYLHSKNILHRDVKPDNFVLGTRDDKKIYIIDFGLAKKYTKIDGTGHISYRDDKKLTGTARYASIYTHLGIQQGRRDDLEGLCHVLIYFLKGRLPWQRIKAQTKAQRYNKIMQTKAATPLKKLCQNIPDQFITFMKTVRKLQFEQKPDYAYLKNLFHQMMISHNYEMDYQYSWKLSQNN